jgi:hypothetical protein
MKNPAFQDVRFIKALLSLIFLSLFVSCVSNNTANQNSSSNNNTANIAETSPANASDDAEALANVIKLPITPDEVFWLETPAPSPNAKKLVAVLKFSPVDSEALIQQVQKIAPPTDASIEPEEWFPPELIAQSETAGDQSLKGKQFDARDFVQAPYTKGRLIKLEQAGYFVLELNP